MVDDSDMNRKMMCRSLKKLFHFIDEASDGDEAVAKVRDSLERSGTSSPKLQSAAKDHPSWIVRAGADVGCGFELGDVPLVGQGSTLGGGYDVIFMDYIMPKQNGPEATRAIRELGFTGKVIGVTGNALPGDVRIFEEHGADAVLIKPVELGMIRKKLRDLIPV